MCLVSLLIFFLLVVLPLLYKKNIPSNSICQDLVRGRTIGSGRAHGGLYLLDSAEFVPPFDCVYGYKPRAPIDLVPLPPDARISEPAVK